MNNDGRNDEEQQFIPTSLAHVIITDEIVVILDLRSDEFLGLSKVARQMWMHVAEGKTPLEILHMLEMHYEVEPARLLTNLLQFIHTMEGRGLLECRDEGQQRQSLSLEAITLEWPISDGVTAFPIEARGVRECQNPEWQESFIALQRVDDLIKQVGLNIFAHALMDLSTYRTISAEDAEVQRLANVVIDATDWLPFKAACFHQCLALAWMLRRRHVCVDIVMGMYTHPFSVHVWLESDGHVVQWRAGMGYYADFRRIEAMSVIFHTGKLASLVGGKVE